MSAERSIVERLVERLGPDGFHSSLSDAERGALPFLWPAWRRPAQAEPAGDWSVWLLLAGRGFGKTRVGAETVRERVERGKSKRIAIVSATAADGRDTMVEGESGILAVADPSFRPRYEPSKRRLTWPNGAIATVYSAEKPDRLRGPQHDFSWCDELCSWRHLSAWDNLEFGLRLGKNPQTIVTTTPRPIKLLKDMLADPGTVTTRGSTYDNRSNLARKFLAKVLRKYEGTRLGRQELMAEILEDVEGALWTYAMLEAARCPVDEQTGLPVLPDFVRTVVAVDPAGKANANSDETGIVVASKGVDGLAYVRADLSCKLSPDGWARRAVAGAKDFEADRVVGEENNGGDMVEHTVRTVDPNASYKSVRASKGKAVRAEPIAALFEQDKVRIVGHLPLLEDQLTQMTPDGYVGEGSPDRLDAMVWALTELMLGEEIVFE